ncbi:MAG: phage DNA encapsidation protein [Clostridia bacterium]|nr:phage DNA encapsidation protein [Clostridia bacterium]
MKYFSANGILGRGAVFNQVYSDRSDGKTFDIKYRAVQRFIKHGYATVYVRRWKTEITVAMYQTFLDEVFRVYPTLNIFDIRASKTGIEARPKGQKDIPYRYMIYFMPISIANKIKSNFDPIPVREIDFDEYVPLDGRYAPDEMINLMELYRTCDRDRNVVKLCTFGNRITGSTPFLNFFNINPDITVPKIRVYKQGTIAIQVYMNEEHREEVNSSPMATALAGTVYESYMKGGILESSEAVIRQRPSDTMLWASFRSEAGSGSIFSDSDGHYYVTDKAAAAPTTITDKAYGMDGEIVASYNAVAARLKQLYRMSCLYATSERAWTIFQPIFKIAISR